MSNERPTPEFIELLKRSGDSDKTVAIQAQREIAKALETPLRKGVLFGDVVRGIYEAMPLEPGASPEFPLDLLAPGTEIDHVAFTNPGNGRIPERHVEGDYVMINTYGITSSIDFLLKYAREANWNVVGRAMQVLESSFVKKINDDGWHTLLASAVDRNILVYDGDAGAGQFTKRLVSLMKTVMRRNGGGNSVTAPGRLTDLYMSPEAIEDIRNWGVDQLDEVSRREIYVANDDGPALTRVFGVNLHDLFEFGDGQEYQEYFINDLGGSIESNDVELVIGLDQSANDSFVMPVKKEVEIFEDPALHRHQRQGYYGWAEIGFGVLDNRRIIAGSF
jgi:3D (Asp-Asp-Asp) domain-containing protein